MDSCGIVLDMVREGILVASLYILVRDIVTLYLCNFSYSHRHMEKDKCGIKVLYCLSQPCARNAPTRGALLGVPQLGLWRNSHFRGSGITLLCFCFDSTHIGTGKNHTLLMPNGQSNRKHLNPNPNVHDRKFVHMQVTSFFLRNQTQE